MLPILHSYSHKIIYLHHAYHKAPYRSAPTEHKQLKEQL